MTLSIETCSIWETQWKHNLSPKAHLIWRIEPIEPNFWEKMAAEWFTNRLDLSVHVTSKGKLTSLAEVTLSNQTQPQIVRFQLLAYTGFISFYSVSWGSIMLDIVNLRKLTCRTMQNHKKRTTRKSDGFSSLTPAQKKVFLFRDFFFAARFGTAVHFHGQDPGE